MPKSRRSERFSAALGWRAFFQSAPLHETGGASSPAQKLSPEVLRSPEEICDYRPGKGVVAAKDTPNFIANRVGVFSILNAIREMQALEMTVEEVDACTGPAIGWPSSATFRTADIVGLDVLVHVVSNLYDNMFPRTNRP